MLENIREIRNAVWIEGQGPPPQHITSTEILHPVVLLPSCWGDFPKPLVYSGLLVEISEILTKKELPLGLCGLTNGRTVVDRSCLRFLEEFSDV